MDNKEFITLVNYTFKTCKRVMDIRSDDYSSGSDRLHNFKRAAAMEMTTPEKALVGMWAKHIVSILDMVDRVEEEEDLAVWEEKLGDLINYTLLLKALVHERHGE